MLHDDPVHSMTEIPADENIRLGGLGPLGIYCFRAAGRNWSRRRRRFGMGPPRWLAILFSLLFAELLLRAEHRPGGLVFREHATHYPGGMERRAPPAGRVPWRQYPLPNDPFSAHFDSDIAGNAVLYPWVDPAAVAGSELLRHKAVYLATDIFWIPRGGIFCRLVILDAVFSYTFLGTRPHRGRRRNPAHGTLQPDRDVAFCRHRDLCGDRLAHVADARLVQHDFRGILFRGNSRGRASDVDTYVIMPAGRRPADPRDNRRNTITTWANCCLLSWCFGDTSPFPNIC